MNSRPVVIFDLEATGTDIAADRIVEFAAVKLPNPLVNIINHAPQLVFRCNPEIPIPAEATAVHGITNEDVSGLPPFRERAREVLAFIDGCDLAGFNLSNFDVPLLWEEFWRAEIEWDLVSQANIIDAGTLFKKREPRTLAAALKFYCGEELTNAHEALSDVIATASVLSAQLRRYDLGGKDRAELAAETAMDRRVDLAGKIVRRESDGVPVYNFGKVKGTPVLEDLGFARWMMMRNFPTHTIRTLEAILSGELS